MTARDFLTDEHRQRLLSALGCFSSDADAVADPIRGFLPLRSYGRALQAQTIVVRGERGAGKTALFRFLRALTERRVPVRRVFPDLPDTPVLWVEGFSESDKAQPQPAVLDQAASSLTEDDLRTLWVGHLAARLGSSLPDAAPLPEPFGTAWRSDPTSPGAWLDSARTSLPALVRWLDDVDTALASRGESVQVTYDHLDKLGQTNPALRERYVLSLLALWLSLSNRYTRVRPKVFLREDLFDRARQTPDGSKLETRSTRLEWNREDLFRVLLRHLGTDYELKAWTDAWPQPLSWVHDEVLGWMPPDALPEEGPVSQKGVAEQIVDAVMGAGTKKGYTHRWIPNHLQDARGSIVPRSIVNLFAFAAEYASENGPKAIGAHLLRPFELQAGLEKTSLYRVAELKEEHRVVGRVLPSLGILLCQAGRSQLRTVRPGIREKWEVLFVTTARPWTRAVEAIRRSASATRAPAR